MFRCTHSVSNSERRSPVASTLPMFWESAVKPRPDHRDPLNLVEGAFKRNASLPTKPCPTVWKDIKRFTRLFCRHYLHPIQPGSVKRFNVWIVNTPYTQERKNQLIKLYSEMTRGVNRRNRNNIFKKLKSFCKDEPYLTWKKPRMINSRVDAAKIFCGPIFSQMSDELFALPPFIKYTPFLERPEVIRKHLMKEGGIYAADDFESFEAHFDKQHMEIEDIFYSYMVSKLGKEGELFMDFVHGTIEGVNKCQFRDFTMEIPATRMSGEMNTSLGNSFTNLILHAYWFWVNSGRPTDPNILRSYIYENIKVEGDDSLAVYFSKELVPTSAQMALTGFKVEHLEFDNIGDASFCGAVFDPDDMNVVTDPLDVLSSFGWCGRKYIRASPKLRLELLRAKAMSYLYQYRGCPIVDPLCRRAIFLTDGVVIRQSIIDGENEYERQTLIEALLNYNSSPTLIGYKTRTLVERLYNIPIFDQLKLEAKILSLPFGPFQFPELDHLIPASWRRTSYEYVKLNHDDTFICPQPISSAEEHLTAMKNVKGAEKSFTHFLLSPECKGEPLAKGKGNEWN